MKATDCGHVACENCGAIGDEHQLEPTGRVRKRLLTWQHHLGGPQGRNGPIFNVTDHGVEEAEVTSSCCAFTFWTLAPAAVEAAKAVPAHRYDVVDFHTSAAAAAH